MATDFSVFLEVSDLRLGMLLTDGFVVMYFRGVSNEVKATDTSNPKLALFRVWTQSPMPNVAVIQLCACSGAKSPVKAGGSIRTP